MRCRILFLLGELVAGGQEQQLIYLLQEMDRQKYRPGLVVWNYEESDVNVPKVQALGVPIWGYPIEASSHQKLYYLMRLARSLSVEVVHSYGFYTNFAAYCAARAAGAIGLGSVQNEIDPPVFINKRPVIGRLSASLPRLQISNSHAAAKRIMAGGKWFMPGKLTIVTNPIDVTRFQVEPVPMSLPPVILGIGSLVPFKRWDRLLKITHELKRLKIPVQVQIAGDGPSRGELETMAFKLGIADMVIFLGYQTDVPALIGKARLVVHTSDAEGLPNVLMEALAGGRPVVATDAGDTGMLINNGRTGFVVQCDDEETMLARIVDIITNDDLARRMGRAAREYAQREFSMSRPLKQVFDAYSSEGWKP
jgi:glycosyltransferase involved in cell wall biosynthesis